MKKIVENFSVGAKVTWRKNESSTWLQRLKEKFGEGPFEVSKTELSIYGIPKVSLIDQYNQTLLHSEGKDMFLKSWLQSLD